MFKRGNLHLRSEAIPSFDSGRTLDQDESEVQQNQGDQGMGVNKSTLNVINPKFMKQMSSQKSFGRSPSKKFSFGENFLGVSTPKGDKAYVGSPQRSNFGLSPSERDKDKDRDSDKSDSQINSPHFGRFAMKLAQLNKQMPTSPMNADKNSSILLDISPKNVTGQSKDIKSTKTFGSSFGGQNLKGLTRSKTGTKHTKNAIAQQASTKVLDLIHDKAYGAYENEVKEEIRMKAIRLKTRNFGKMLQKHIVKGSGPKIFSVLNKVRDEGKSRREKIADWIAKTTKLLRKKKTECVETAKKLLRPFNPDGTITLIWEFVLMLLLGLDLILVPFTLAFEDELQLHEDSLNGFEAWQIVFYVIDMLINMHTSYNDDGTLELSHTKIIKKYMKKFIWIDLLSSYPYRWVEQGAGIRDESMDTAGTESIYQVFAPLKLLRLLRLLRFVRIFKFQRIKRYLEQSEYFGPVVVSIISLFKLSLFISLLAHWCACMWFIIGTTNHRYTWLEKAELPEEVNEQYIAALYFTLTTMLTVGYGDIGPVNLRERVFAIFMMLLGGGVFGYTMNSIALILQSLEGEKSKKKKKIKAMMNYLERKKLNNDIKDRIMKYMKFKLENEEGNRNEDHHLMSMLSVNLREEVSRQINGRFINQNEVFQSILTKKLKDVLHLYLDERIFAPHEPIYTKDDPDFSLFFVSKGKVELHYDRFKRPLGSIEKGKYFGQIAFFSGDAPTFMARSVEFSHLVYISRTKILQVLEKFPTDKEMFAMIRDKIKLYNNYVDLQLKCKICDEVTHITTQCPKTHSIFNQEDTIKACLWERRNFQKSFERRKKKPFNARLNMKSLTNKAHIFQDEYGYRKRSYSHEFMSADFDNFTKKNDKRFLSPEPLTKPKPKSLFLVQSRKSLYEHQESAVPDEEIPTISHVGGGPSTRRENRMMTATNYVTLTVVGGEQGQGQAQGQEREKEKEHKQRKEHEPLDRVKNYEVYFPYNNITKILETLNRKQKKGTGIFLSPLQKREKLTTKLANAFISRKQKKIPRANSFTVSPFNGKVASLAPIAPVTQIPLLSLFSNPTAPTAEK